MKKIFFILIISIILLTSCKVSSDTDNNSDSTIWTIRIYVDGEGQVMTATVENGKEYSFSISSLSRSDLDPKRIAAWGLRPGLPIGCKLILRGKEIPELLKEPEVIQVIKVLKTPGYELKN